MAKRRPKTPRKTRQTARKKGVRKASGRRPARKAAARRKPAAKARAKKAAAPARKARLDRARRTLNEQDDPRLIPTPPSSLNMDRHGSAARSGRKEIADRARLQRGMSRGITGGDVDVDLEDAYFTGDEAPGGDNPTPDQEIVDDIGRALGVEYADNEELKSSDKVTERDRHRWELDPASSEDYKNRK
jgi:hypothetical protein